MSPDATVDAAAVVFGPVRAGNALEETLARLGAALRLGLVTEGSRLPAERDLAARLEVSRMTLREALRCLQAAGCVESRRGRHGGTFVVARLEGRLERLPRAPSAGTARAAGPGAVADLLALREVVEVGAAGRAARRGLAEVDRAHLVRRLEACARAGPAAYRRLDARLHLAVAEATGSPSVVAAAAEVRIRLDDFLALSPAPPGPAVMERSNGDHEAVVAAILSGRPEVARAAMGRHLEATAARLRGLVG